MAKTIKTIKCPQCGSVHKTQLKDDHYRCDDCNTEYFLDSDDITVHVNHQHSFNKENQQEVIQPRLFKVMIPVAIVVSLGILGVSSLFQSGNRKTSQSYVSSQRDPNRYRELPEDSYGFAHGNQAVHSLSPIERMGKKAKMIKMAPTLYSESWNPVKF